MNENLERKKTKYEEAAKKATSKYKEEMKQIKKVIEAIENNSVIEDTDSLETIIFKLYLELENVKRVADYVNADGYRIKTDSWIGQRKYTTNDISAIIESDADVETKLKEAVKGLHLKNCIAMANKMF